MLQGVVAKDMTAKENADKGAFSNHETVKSDKILRLELLLEMRRLEADERRMEREADERRFDKELQNEREKGKFDPPPPKNPLTDGHENLCS